MNDFVYKNDDIGGEEGGDKARSARDAVYIFIYVFSTESSERVLGKKINDRYARVSI